MPQYAIYKYLIKRSEQTDLFTPPAASDLSFEAEQEIFGKAITDTLPVIRYSLKDKSDIPLECSLICKRGDVSVRLLCNEKLHSYEERKEKKELRYHPGSFIIIDNRPNVAQIAIEHTSAFDNVDQAKQILENGINSVLEKYGLSVEIRPKHRAGDFWQIVNEQQTRYNDRVRKVVFDFPNPKEKGPVDASEDYTLRISNMMALAEALNGAKGTLQIDADDKANSTLHLDRTQEDLAQMVKLCSRNGYDIAVYFAKFGIYRYSSQATLKMNMEENILEEFINGQTMFGNAIESQFRLTGWLDEIKELPEGEDHEIQTSKKRKRSYHR